MKNIILLAIMLVASAALHAQNIYKQRHQLSADNREWDWNPDKVTLPNDLALVFRIR